MKKSKNKTIAKLPEKKPGNLSLWWWLAGILALTIIAYWFAFTNGFTDWDDTYYVTENSHIRSLSLHSILSFFTSLQTQGNYHPLTLLSLAIDYQLFGLNATGYHTINIMWHILNVCLVFMLTQKLFKANFITIATTLLFAIHPMHVESVAWVSERKDVLYVFFYLSGLCCYVTYLDNNKRKYLIYAVVCFILSLLCKAQAVTFPLALLIVDYIKSEKFSVKSFLTITALFAISLLFGIVAVFAQHQVNATDLYVHYSILDRIIYTGYAFALYIVKLIAPVTLAAFYPYPDKTSGWFSPFVYFSLLIPMGLAGLLFICRKHKIVIGGLLFFTLNIVLVLQMLPVGDAIIAERYTYLSYLGLFWALAYGINYFIQKMPIMRTIILGFGSIYIIFLSYLCFSRVPVWQDSFSLWNDELNKFDKVPVAWNNMGMIYEGKNDATNAKVCFSHAINLDPDYSVSYSNRSMAYIQLAQYDSAIHDDNKALKLRPDNKTAHQNRGAAYGLAEKGDSSLLDCNWLVAHYPNDLSAHVNLGLAYNSALKYDSAVLEFSAILAQYPDNEVCHFNRGVAYTILNKPNEAIADYNKALELKNTDWQAYSYRAHTYLLAGNNEKAIEDATVSIQNSHDPIVNDLITRAQAYTNTAHYREALQDYLTMQKMGVPIEPSILEALNKKAGN